MFFFLAYGVGYMICTFSCLIFRKARIRQSIVAGIMLFSILPYVKNAHGIFILYLCFSFHLRKASRFAGASGVFMHVFCSHVTGFPPSSCPERKKGELSLHVACGLLLIPLSRFDCLILRKASRLLALVAFFMHVFCSYVTGFPPSSCRVRKKAS